MYLIRWLTKRNGSGHAVAQDFYDAGTLWSALTAQGFTVSVRTFETNMEIDMWTGEEVPGTASRDAAFAKCQCESNRLAAGEE